MKHCLIGLLLLLFSAPLLAQNGEFIRNKNEGKYQSEVWFGLDAETSVVTAGVPIRIGPFETLTIHPESGINGTNTYSVDCGVGDPTDTTNKIAPTTWDPVFAVTGDTDGQRLIRGDSCEWVRVNMITTDTASTVLVRAEKLR